MDLHKALTEAQLKIDAVQKEIASGYLLTNGEAQMLNDMANQITNLRNSMVQYELTHGVSGKDVARKYSLSEARISQIKAMEKQ
jgi:hypothetical protein